MLSLDNKTLASLILDNLYDYAVFAIDTQGVISSWHPGVKTVLGFKQDDFVGQPFSLIFTDADVKAGIPDKELRVASETERALDERWHLKGDGELFYALGIVTVLENDQDELIGYAKVLRDATDRKALQEAQKAQAESDRRYRTLFNATEEGFCVIKMIFDDTNRALDYRFLETNAQFEAQMGFKDVTGKEVRELIPNLEEHWFETYGQVP